MDRQRLIYLIKKYQQGTCSATEHVELYQLMQHPDIEQEILRLWNQLHQEKTLAVSPADSKRLYDRILATPEIARLMRDTPSGATKRKRLLKLRKIAVVAATIAIFLTGYFSVMRPRWVQPEIVEQQATVLPGSNKARIVFGDGSYQELGNGTPNIDGESRFFTVNGKNGDIDYREVPHDNELAAEVHTLITPKGGEYAVQLADGTKVWVNANSKLRYPVSFHGAAAREVVLEGEAYFEVAKSNINDTSMPFIVKSQGQVLEVLGTTFNINTFQNKVTTTLLEGRVKVAFEEHSAEQSYVLQPHEQSIYDKQSKTTNIKTIDPYYVTAWKSGDFAFDNAPLKSVMDDIARWYDVRITYQSAVDDVRFSGKVSKFENIDTLLQTIEWTGSVKLKRDGRRITVMK